jgi:hypothetical protein
MLVGVKGMCKAVIQLIKMFHDLLKDIFPKVPPTQEKAMPTKRCVELQTQQKEGDCFGALSVRLDFVFRTVSIYFTRTLVFKVRSYCIFRKLRGFSLYLHKSHQKPVIVNRTIIVTINSSAQNLSALQKKPPTA